MTKTCARWAIWMLLSCAAVWPRAVGGGDWPTWRHDPGRSGAAPDELPTTGGALNLHLQWERALPPARPAWPASQFQLQFDTCHEPVALGQRLFVPSNATDSVAAYSTATGEELWLFHANAPIRFAPVAHRFDDGEERVYAASDDGYLYCLNAEDGAVVWKFRAAPSGRKLVGNHRLTSAWPVRGAPVLVDGKIYCAASIWPFMGIFYYALDARTGDTVWANTGSGSVWQNQPHGGSVSFSNLVPQGYLAAAGDRLIVPGGRTTPGIMDRNTGELLFFVWEGKGIGGPVYAGGEYCYNGGAMLSLSNGQAVGQAEPVLLHKSGFISVRYDSSRRAPVISLNVLSDTTAQKIDRSGRKRNVSRSSVAQTYTVVCAGMPKQLFAKAGAQYFFGETGRVACAELAANPGSSSGACRPLWSATIEGEPGTMLVADDKLFVVTREGGVYCFGGEEVADPGRFALPRKPAPREPDEWTARAKTILEETGARAGYCLVLGAGSGRLAEELRQQSKLNVIALDSDAENVRTLRRRWTAAGWYGERLSVLEGAVQTAQLPPYLANLVVAENSAAAGVGADGFTSAVFAALRPYGGVACLDLEDEARQALRQDLLDPALVPAELTTTNGLTLLARPGALPGAADWTHNRADAANSVVSKDQLVKAPLGLLWFGGPSHDRILPRHGHGPSPQVAGGRLIIEGIKMLRAVDVYTGRLLWDRELPQLNTVGMYYDGAYTSQGHIPGANAWGSNYVATADRIYLAQGRECLVLDPASGETLARWPLTAAGSPNWGFVASWENLLIAGVRPLKIGSAQVSKSKGNTDGGNTGAPSKPPKNVTPQSLRPLESKNGEWRYLAETHPPGNWTAPDFDDSEWKTGRAGFGFGDDGLKTTLKGMRGKSSVIYIRREFDRAKIDAKAQVGLTVNYDDAFIAYLNDTEVLRVGVGNGFGEGASRIANHEANGHQFFAINGFQQHLRDGVNVIAIEGHNRTPRDPDLTLDPYLATDAPAPPDSEAPEPEDPENAEGAPAEEPPEEQAAPDDPAEEPLPLGPYGAEVDARYAEYSRELVVLDRYTSKTLWTRKAVYGFRHNTIIAGGGKVFCIDGLTEAKLSELRKKGFNADAPRRLYALDARTGAIVWWTDEDVFGTWLGYSEEHDALVQAGSAYRDRAPDEAARGMAVYRGKNGEVIWKDRGLSYSGPPILHHERIITNGSGGFALELLTGERTGWSWSRTYGCNTAVASEHLMTFRSGAAGYYDLTGDSGTGSLGGFKSGCTSNLIPANGVLNAPDYTRTCVCSYQNQTSLALIHWPEAEMWTFGGSRQRGALGVNLGAPGNRRGPSGALWLEFPNVGGDKSAAPLRLTPSQPTYFRHHAALVTAGELKWVAASGARGLTRAALALDAPGTYTVRLVFCEIDSVEAGERVFDVALNGKMVLEDFDIIKAAGGPLRSVVKEFADVKLGSELALEFTPKAGGAKAVVLSGLEAVKNNSSE